MQCRVLFFSVILSMVVNQAIAGAMGTLTSTKNWTWVTSINVGPVWESAGQTQTLLLAPNIEKNYVAANPTHTLVDGEIFIGIQKKLHRAIQGQLGLVVAATSNAGLSGDIWDDANSNFNNFTYDYQIQHTHVAVKGKLLIDRDYWVMPWVSASLGLGFNHAHGYQNTPSIYEAVTMPNFSSNMQTSFTYTLGVGIQKALDRHWQIGGGYEFSDWGQSNLGSALGQTINQGLVLNNLYTSGAMFNVTWLA